jgi:hypothetical protein
MAESFLKFYRNDINLYFPEFHFTSDDERICFLVLREAMVANIFVARKAEEGSIIVEINYTVPKYRDYKVGQFIFEEGSEYLRLRGVRTIYTKSYYREHTHFLQRMGFQRSLWNGEEYYERRL